MSDARQSNLTILKQLKEDVMNGGYNRVELNKLIKEISKMEYDSSVKYHRLYVGEKCHFHQACVWGHIHNLKKDKAQKALKNLEDYISELINDSLFNGKPMEITVSIKGVKKSYVGEEAFRIFCEGLQTTIDTLKVVISIM